MSDTPRQLALHTMLAAVREFESASPELVAWEFAMPVDDLRPQWARAVEATLLTVAGTDPDYGETMYRVTEQGERWLRQAPARRQPP